MSEDRINLTATLEDKYVTISVHRVEFAKFDGQTVPMWVARVSSEAVFERSSSDDSAEILEALRKLGLKGIRFVQKS